MALPDIVPKEGEIWRHGQFGKKTYWYFFKAEGQLKRGQLGPIHTRKFPLKKISDEGRGRVHLQGTFRVSGEFAAKDIVHGRDTWERFCDPNQPPPRMRL